MTKIKIIILCVNDLFAFSFKLYNPMRIGWKASDDMLVA